MIDLISNALVFLRYLIDDVDESNYEYSDNRLTGLIFVAASYVNRDINGSYDINICGQSIAPNPDSNFINLVSLKAACLHVRSQQTSFARNDFRVSDGPTTVDLKSSSEQLKKSADDMCNLYEKAKLDMIMGRTVNGYITSTPNSES